MSRGSWRLMGSCCSRKPSVFGNRMEEFYLAAKSAEFSFSSRLSSSANCCGKVPTTQGTNSRIALRWGWSTPAVLEIWSDTWGVNRLRVVVLNRWPIWRCRTVWMETPVSLCCGLGDQQNASHCRHPLPALRWAGWRLSLLCWTPRTTSCQVSTAPRKSGIKYLKYSLTPSNWWSVNHPVETLTTQLFSSLQSYSFKKYDSLNHLLMF